MLKADLKLRILKLKTKVQYSIFIDDLCLIKNCKALEPLRFEVTNKCIIQEARPFRGIRV